MNATWQRTWTLDDIRHDLAVEIRSLRRLARMYAKSGYSYDPAYYPTVISYARELGHNLYERPERKRR